MKIRSVRIRNFRSFDDETIHFDAHTCLLGPNGAGKSSVLAALNVFFQEHSSATDVTSLSAEDFHNGITKEPVEITVTFCDLPEQAKQDLSHYVRHNELIATAEAKFDAVTERAPVERYGERLIFEKFAPFFEDEKIKVKVDPLRERFKEITEGVEGFPDLGAKPTKPAMMAALQDYEEANPALCSPTRSTDLFYGATKGKDKIDPFIQWVYLPAVKDASEEAEEAGNTALGKLLQRTVRKKMNFDDALEALRQKTRAEYDEILETKQDALKDISDRLAKRLATYSHSNASLEVMWLQGSEKSVSINDPKATIKAQEGKFKGSLPRFGHGLQRSFLLAILQELALLETELEEDEDFEQPTLVFACEEPELYQHPPQARHLANVLRSLSASGSQVLLTTHSPYFVSGEAFEEIRLIRKDSASGKSNVQRTDFERYAKRISDITGEKPDKPAVARAKLYAALQPEPAELFFCNGVVLVEGIEDRSYVTTALVLEDKWDDVRRAGLHIVPADGKSGILQLLVIAQEMDIPSFVVFDADGHVTKEKWREAHERDNKHLMSALNIASKPFPSEALWGENYAIWPTEIEMQIKDELGNKTWTELTNKARKVFDPGESLAKNPLLIAETLRLAWEEGKKPSALTELTKSLIGFVDA